MLSLGGCLLYAVGMFLVYRAAFPNGKVYVGKTNDLPNRVRQHRHTAKTSTLKFYRAWRKYGEPTWDVVINALTEPAALVWEIILIDSSGSKKHGYNSTAGGEGVSGLRHTDESIRRMSAAHKARPRQRGIKQRPEVVEARAARLRGQPSAKRSLKGEREQAALFLLTLGAKGADVASWFDTSSAVISKLRDRRGVPLQTNKGTVTWDRTRRRWRAYAYIGPAIGPKKCTGSFATESEARESVRRFHRGIREQLL